MTRKPRTELAKDDPRHGTANGYNNFGCKCDLCKAAWSSYKPRLAALDRWRVKRGIVSPAGTRSRQGPPRKHELAAESAETHQHGE